MVQKKFWNLCDFCITPFFSRSFWTISAGSLSPLCFIDWLMFAWDSDGTKNFASVFFLPWADQSCLVCGLLPLPPASPGPSTQLRAPQLRSYHFAWRGSPARRQARSTGDPGAKLVELMQSFQNGGRDWRATSAILLCFFSWFPSLLLKAVTSYFTRNQLVCELLSWPLWVSAEKTPWGIPHSVPSPSYHSSDSWEWATGVQHSKVIF